MNIQIQGLDPRVELAHYNEVIQSRRDSLGLEGAPLPPVLLLEAQEDRKRYLLCLTAVKLFDATKGTRGITTFADMLEHIELVDEISQVQTQTPASELRRFSLVLLRNMRAGYYAKQA